jgi:5-amino-6-(5-phospho-D-ribitylamino)uracil phosphatase
VLKDNYDFKNVKLIALDLDGTLLDDRLDVSQRTKKTIIDLVRRGICVALVSGRTYKATEFIRERLEVDIPVIAYDGGKVVIPDKDEIFCAKISLNEALKVIKYGEERDLYVKVYIDDVLYIKEPDKESLSFSKSRNINYKVVGKLSENIKQDVNMIVIYYNEDINGVIDEKLKDIDATITTSVSNSIDAIPKGISKEEGLKMLADHLNIERENILAVGNSLNDLEMLRYAGIGFAMKNSDKSLLTKWDNVSQYTNNEEGVYHIIKQI